MLPDRRIICRLLDKKKAPLMHHNPWRYANVDSADLVTRKGYGHCSCTISCDARSPYYLPNPWQVSQSLMPSLCRVCRFCVKNRIRALFMQYKLWCNIVVLSAESLIRRRQHSRITILDASPMQNRQISWQEKDTRKVHALLALLSARRIICRILDKQKATFMHHNPWCQTHT